MFEWLLTEFRAIIRSELQAMEKRIMAATLKDVKDAEDRLGQSIVRATAQNAANVKALADAIANEADQDELEALATEAKAHADAMDAAFPDTTANAGTTGTAPTAA